MEPNQESRAWSSGVSAAVKMKECKNTAYSWQFDNPLVAVDIATGEVMAYRFKDVWAKEGFRRVEAVE